MTPLWVNVEVRWAYRKSRDPFSSILLTVVSYGVTFFSSACNFSKLWVTFRSDGHAHPPWAGPRPPGKWDSVPNTAMPWPGDVLVSAPPSGKTEISVPRWSAAWDDCFSWPDGWAGIHSLFSEHISNNVELLWKSKGTQAISLQPQNKFYSDFAFNKHFSMKASFVRVFCYIWHRQKEKKTDSSASPAFKHQINKRGLC